MGDSDPPYQRKSSHQDYNRTNENWPKAWGWALRPRCHGCRRGWKRRNNDGDCEQNKNWYVANRVQGSEGNHEQRDHHAPLGPRAGTGERSQKHQPEQQKWTVERLMKIRGEPF